MRATATGVTTYGSSTLIRQKVLARRFWSRIAAMKSAAMSWGIADSRKMLKVLKIEFQNHGSRELVDVVVEADPLALALEQVPVVERDDEGVDEREEPDEARTG